MVNAAAAMLIRSGCARKKKENAKEEVGLSSPQNMLVPLGWKGGGGQRERHTHENQAWCALM